jgi:general secretion pathway protein D
VQTYGLQGQTPPLQGFSYTLTGNNYTAFLNALETNTKFKVLDTPRVFTSNNVPATIDVSTQVPYITAQQTATIGGLISNYDFKNVGVVLKVTPRITSAGDVAMDVDQSADDLQGFTTFNAPIINHRQATTTVSVKNGETIILGGIIQQTTTITENKVPILGDIPLLGALFKSVSHDHNQTELMVLLTPHIIRNNAEAQKLRQEETSHLSQSSQSELSHLLPRKTGGGN